MGGCHVWALLLLEGLQLLADLLVGERELFPLGGECRELSAEHEEDARQVRRVDPSGPFSEDNVNYTAKRRIS